MIERDNLHYSFREIDGYNKTLNFVMSPREPGKTTSMWLDKIYLQWKKNKKAWYFLVRNVNEINETLITTIADTTINKFTDDNILFEYKAGDFSNGIVDVRIKGEIIFRIVALNCKLARIKKALLKDPAGIFMDEYIIDPLSGEKYLPQEAFKIQEAYTTWKREYKGKGKLKMYFCGNPYSLYNPLFVKWKVNVNKLKRDSFYVGEDFVIHWAVLNPALKEKLLKENPFYKFDEEYSNYAVEGQATQDANIKIKPFPNDYKLQFVFKYSNILIGIYRNYNYNDLEDKFYVRQLKKTENNNKKILCLDFAEMIEHSVLIGNEERLTLAIFKNAIRNRQISFENINLYYMVKEIYVSL